MSDVAIQVDRIHRIEGDSKLKAFVDISLDDVVIKGLRVVSGVKGLFVSMPCHQGKDGKWYDTVYPITREKRQELSELVLQAYKE